MNITPALFSWYAWCALAASPFVCLFLLAGRRFSPDCGFPGRALVASVCGIGMLAMASSLACLVDLSILALILPASAIAAACLTVAAYALVPGLRTTVRLDRHHLLLGLIMLAAGAVRIGILVRYPDFLGGSDARFHNLLSQLILIDKTSPDTWEPFASVPVSYPTGCHAMVALLAGLSGRPVHEGWTALASVSAILTTGILYIIARNVFRSRSSGVWASAAYAFLPLAGSLDYVLWGGLPNSMGMLFACLVIRYLALPSRSDPGHTALDCLAAGLAMPMALCVHNHSPLAIALMLLFAFVLVPALRTEALAVLLVSVGLSLPLAVCALARHGGTMLSTAILMFREQPISLLDCVKGAGPFFVAWFATALVLSIRRRWTNPQAAVWAWLAGLFSAFVFTEYVYRFAVLLFLQGKDWFTCLTPSRFVADMTYPMAILIGVIPVSALWLKRQRALRLLLVLTCILSVTAFLFLSASRNPPPPDQRECAQWLKKNTPARAMIVGSFPHVEYIAWRETSHPPLPASEQRLHPAVLAKQSRSVAQWLKWRNDSGRPVYFITTPGGSPPAGFQFVFTNKAVAVLSPTEQNAPKSGK